MSVKIRQEPALHCKDWLSILLLLGAATLAGCGSGAGDMSNSASNGAAAPAQSCSTCGTALVTMTDAPGDFISYIVNVVSLQLTRSDGTVVETVPATTQIDFAQLVDLSEIIGADQVASGQYVSASLTLDYSGATIVVDNGTGGVTIAADNIINAATSKPLAAPNPTQVTLTVMLDANNRLVITPNAVANLALDFNLAASNAIAPSAANPTTVTVNPVLSASLVPDTVKQIRVRGPLVNAGAASFTIAVRPFFNAGGSNGQLTVETTAATSYAVNGTNYTGSAGATALAGLPAGTMIVAYGSWDLTTQTVTAANVLAGSSVPATRLDSLTGSVIARTGNTLTVADGLIERAGFGGVEFSSAVTVTLGTATSVTEQGQSGSFAIQNISVGQRVQVSGTSSGTSGSGASTGTPSLDASAGSVQLIPTRVAGTVTAAAGTLITVNLYSLGGRPASSFNFSGTGATSAQDAAATAYTVALPASLATSAASLGAPVQFTGFVAPFGAAPPDFNATSLASYANAAAIFEVRWAAPGDLMPFSTLTSTQLSLGQTALQASAQSVIRIAFETIDPSTLAAGVQLVPDPSATHPSFAIGHVQSWRVDNFDTFTNFAAALTADLTGTTSVLQLAARGPFAAATGVLSADDIAVVLSD
jgi:hypothetical protein